MLDSETKAKIDSARDILVERCRSKSQVEQITIALIYKFMYDMDCQSEELGGKAAFFPANSKSIPGITCLTNAWVDMNAFFSMRRH